MQGFWKYSKEQINHKPYLIGALYMFGYENFRKITLKTF